MYILLVPGKVSKETPRRKATLVPDSGDFFQTFCTFPVKIFFSFFLFFCFFFFRSKNYAKALKRLKERYDNKVLIFLEHVNNLFSAPNMIKGDNRSLRKIIDTVSAIRGSLLSLGSEGGSVKHN